MDTRRDESEGIKKMNDVRKNENTVLENEPMGVRRLLGLAVLVPAFGISAADTTGMYQRSNLYF